MILTSQIHKITKISKNSANRIPKWISDINAVVGDEIVVTFDIYQESFERLPKVRIENLRTGDTTKISIKYFSAGLIEWRNIIGLESI